MRVPHTHVHLHLIMPWYTLLTFSAGGGGVGSEGCFIFLQCFVFFFRHEYLKNFFHQTIPFFDDYNGKLLSPVDPAMNITFRRNHPPHPPKKLTGPLAFGVLCCTFSALCCTLSAKSGCQAERNLPRIPFDLTLK